MKTPSDDPTRFIPLPSADLHILMALASGDKHGYAIMQQVAGETNGQVRLGPGTLYGAIKRLREAGVIAESKRSATRAEGGERRRCYRLTALGRKVLSAELDRLAAVFRIARAAGLVSARLPAAESAL